MPQSALRQFTPQSAEPAVRSYNPFNPAFRETMRSGITDLLGGRAMGGTPSQRYRAGMADMLTGAVDFVPGVSEAVGVADTVQAARGGNYGTAAILGGATALGMVPVVGDAASKAVRGALPFFPAAPAIKTTRGSINIGSDIKNMGSIPASLENYEIVDGLQMLPINAFETTKAEDLFYAKNDRDRVRKLSEQIEANKRIDPLIVVQDAEGYYVLEGGHRLGALDAIGAENVPAIIVKDLDYPYISELAPSPLEGTLDMSQAARPIQNAAEDSFTVYQGTPHVFGPNQLVRDVQTGKEYVSDPNMVRAISAANPNRYEVLADNPLGIFDLNRLGTGEGAQAFGEGIYTAESPDVGRFYRGSLLQRSGIDDTPMIGSKPIADVYSEIEQRASKLSGGAASKEYDKLSILEQVMVDNDVLGVTQNKDYFSPEAFDWFSKNVAPNFNRPGALYEVQINSPKSSFLDWDKPLNEQPAGVREKLAALPGVKDTDTGQSIYAAIRSGYMGMENRGESKASLLLKSLGIPGLQYFDEGSRMAGEGSRNYVLFDPKIANITAKYGAGGAAVGLSALRGLQSDEQERKPD